MKGLRLRKSKRLKRGKQGDRGLVLLKAPPNFKTTTQHRGQLYKFEKSKKLVDFRNSVLFTLAIIYRSSRQKVFCKNGVLRNFAKFTGKHLCQNLLFNKAACLRPAILLKKRLWHRCFPVNFAKFLRIPFLTEHLQWLLLHLFCKNVKLN